MTTIRPDSDLNPRVINTKGKIYISGKITGIDNYESLFLTAEANLRSQGYDVVNPVTLNHDHDKSWEMYMRHDIRAMMDCHTIYMLIGYTGSKGAMIEYCLAKDIGMKVVYEGLPSFKDCSEAELVMAIKRIEQSKDNRVTERIK